MDKFKIFLVSFLWLLPFYFFGDYFPIFLTNNINHLLGIFSLIAVFIIVSGLSGYTWSMYKNNKEKANKFKEMVFCGIIVFIIAMINYAMVMVPSVHYTY